jgi:hypothetical protein
VYYQRFVLTSRRLFADAVAGNTRLFYCFCGLNAGHGYWLEIGILVLGIFQLSIADGR